MTTRTECSRCSDTGMITINGTTCECDAGCRGLELAHELGLEQLAELGGVGAHLDLLERNEQQLERINTLESTIATMKGDTSAALELADETVTLARARIADLESAITAGSETVSQLNERLDLAERERQELEGRLTESRHRVAELTARLGAAAEVSAADTVRTDVVAEPPAPTGKKAKA